MFIGLSCEHTRYTRASGSHRCVGTLEAPTSYGNNRLCLRAVGARKLVEILIKGAIPLLTAAANMNCTLSDVLPFLLRQMEMKKACYAALLNRAKTCPGAVDVMPIVLLLPTKERRYFFHVQQKIFFDIQNKLLPLNVIF